MVPHYEDIVKSIITIHESANNANPTYSLQDAQDALKKALNKAFPDFMCRSVTYTANFDKDFFGIIVMPYVNTLPDRLLTGYSIECDKEFEAFKSSAYSLEIDGKLMRDFHLSYTQIAALILQDICALNSTEPMLRLRNAIDNYICLNNIHIEKKLINRHRKIFEMIVIMTLHNLTSVFTRFNFSPIDNVSDVIRDGLYEDFVSAYNILITIGRKDEVNTNTVLLSWYFENYQDFDNNRQVEFLLRDAIRIEPSYYFKNYIKAAIVDIAKYITDHDNRYYDEVIKESTRRKGLLYQMKRNGLKSIEEDLFEYNMRLRNVETQDDAILLMRQINSRMSILEEYLQEEDMDEKDRERWETCYRRYLELREALSKKTVYNKKMYGLFVDYNALQQMNDNGNFMNTYY